MFMLYFALNLVYIFFFEKALDLNYFSQGWVWGTNMTPCWRHPCKNFVTATAVPPPRCHSSGWSPKSSFAVAPMFRQLRPLTKPWSRFGEEMVSLITSVMKWWPCFICYLFVKKIIIITVDLFSSNLLYGTRVSCYVLAFVHMLGFCLTLKGLTQVWLQNILVLADKGRVESLSYDRKNPYEWLQWL